ncbi:uncharacterized protein LOC113312589 [Papaver somniferum]|uniref:uncharacterized protein LOC113312589 n=1 Tax=Papaver somniferum TaxID=3469 RepID=UPI000E6FE658|nr:uncharacterized protein LOC113312589 [Papaver somniferum]
MSGASNAVAGVPCGGESILHSVNRLMELKAQGVQQGDPLGPLLFALILHPIMNKIASQCSLDLQAWYLDDGTIIGDTMEVLKVLNIIQFEGLHRGLHLNVHKTELFWPAADPRSFDPDVFPNNISRPSSGVKLLGGLVSMDLQFCNDMVMQRMNKTIQLMNIVKKLNDPQCELLLLRNFSGVSKLYFTMRTTCPLALEKSKTHFDDHLYQYLRQLVTVDGAGFGPLQYRLVTFPIRDGSLGIYTMSDTTHYCYLASQFQTQFIQRIILSSITSAEPSPISQQALQTFTQVCGITSSLLNFDSASPPSMDSMHSLEVIYFESVKKQLPTNFNMSTRDCMLWQSNILKHAQDYLLAIPISGLNQTLGPTQFRCILSYRLGIPLFPKDSRCTSCNREMDIYGDHALHCASEVGNKFRHDLVRDIFVDICFRAGISARKEA